MKHIALLLLVASFFYACGERTPEEQLEKDIEDIKEYLAEKNLTATETASGLHYIITKEGTGGSPNLSSTVTVKYVGVLLDGTVFDGTPGNQTATFLLSDLIQGWQEGIPLLKKGGRAVFLIPSALGYGNEAKGSIPACSVLIFELELVDFK